MKSLPDIKLDFAVPNNVNANINIDKSKNIKKSTYDIKSIITKQNNSLDKDNFFKSSRILDKPDPIIHPFNPNKNVKPMYIQSLNEDKN